MPETATVEVGSMSAAQWATGALGVMVVVAIVVLARLGSQVEKIKGWRVCLAIILVAGATAMTYFAQTAARQAATATATAKARETLATECVKAETKDLKADKYAKLLEADEMVPSKCKAMVKPWNDAVRKAAAKDSAKSFFAGFATVLLGLGLGDLVFKAIKEPSSSPAPVNPPAPVPGPPPTPAPTPAPPAGTAPGTPPT